jgi:hypothetical protein
MVGQVVQVQLLATADGGLRSVLYHTAGGSDRRKVRVASGSGWFFAILHKYAIALPIWLLTRASPYGYARYGEKRLTVSPLLMKARSPDGRKANLTTVSIQRRIGGSMVYRLRQRYIEERSCHGDD